MMEKMKHFRLKWILRMGFCLALIAAMVLIGAVMASAEVYEGNCGEWGGNVKWYLDTSTGVLELKGSGKMDSSRLFHPASREILESVHKIVIGEGITSIGGFSDCINLTSVFIPSSVLSIQSNAFSRCYKLEYIDIPKSVQHIGSYAFYQCESLREIVIPQGITDISMYSFALCSNLETVVLPDSVKNICCGAFQECIRLKNIFLPQNIVSIEQMAFYMCERIGRIDIPANLKRLGYLSFGGCSGVEAINVDIDNANYYCKGNCLIEAGTNKLILGCNNSIIPNDGNITSIESWAFYNCKRIKTIIVPEGVTTIGSASFHGCASLVKIDLPSSVLSIGESAFAECKSLESIILPQYIEKISIQMFRDCINLSNISLPQNVQSIETFAFFGCEKLEHFVIPESVVFLGQSVFGRCESLKQLVFENNCGWYYTTYSTQLSGTAYNPLIAQNNAQKFTSINSRNYFKCTPTQFTITFIADGKTVATVPYWNTDHNIEIPAVPHKPGYTGVWEDFDLTNGGDITAHAIYTPTESKLTGASVSLGDSLSLNYYATLTPTHTAAQMRFTYHGETITVNGILDETTGEYKFTLGRIPPQCMGDNVKAELILISEDGTETVLDVKESYSIREYCDDALAANPNNEALTTLLADLLAYGDAAQDYANYNEDTPVSEGFEVAPSEWEDVTDTDFTLSDKTRDDIRFTAAGVRFAYVNRLYFKLKAADLTGVTLTVNGKTYTAEDLALVEDTADTYIFYTDPVYATEFDKVFTAELSADGEVIQTVTYSVKSYVCAKQNSNDTEIAALVKTLYNYGRSAIAYKNAQ